MPAKKWFAPDKQTNFWSCYKKKNKIKLPESKSIHGISNPEPHFYCKGESELPFGPGWKGSEELHRVLEVSLKGFAANSIMMQKQLQTSWRFELRRIDGSCDNFDFHKTVWTVTDGSVELSFSLVGITSMHRCTLWSCENVCKSHQYKLCKWYLIQKR